jgi:hypothetical protein
MKKSKPSKTNNHSTHYDFNRSNVKSLLELYSWRQKPMPIEFIDEFADALIEYFYKNSDAMIWERFYNELGVHPQEVERWAARSTKLQEARELVKSLIAERLENKAIASNPTAVFLKIAHWYSKRWNDADNHWKELNKKDNTNSIGDATVTVKD